jgi:hypothetical protein
MKSPRVGQRVWAEGLNGTFAVVRINDAQGVADLELTTGTHRIEKHIPFNAIHPLGGGDVSQAAARIVRESTRDK